MHSQNFRCFWGMLELSWLPQLQETSQRPLEESGISLVHSVLDVTSNWQLGWVEKSYYYSCIKFFRHNFYNDAFCSLKLLGCLAQHLSRNGGYILVLHWRMYWQAQFERIPSLIVSFCSSSKIDVKIIIYATDWLFCQ